MAAPKPNKAEEQTPSGIFHSIVTNSLGEVSQATIRLEEKLTTAVTNQAQLATRFEKLLDNYNTLLERVINIEAQDVEGIAESLAELHSTVISITQKLNDIEKRLNSLITYKEQSEAKFRELEIQGVHMGIFKKSTELKISSILQVVAQVVTGILMGYIAYRLGYPVQ